MYWSAFYTNDKKSEKINKAALSIVPYKTTYKQFILTNYQVDSGSFCLYPKFIFRAVIKLEGAL